MRDGEREPTRTCRQFRPWTNIVLKCQAHLEVAIFSIFSFIHRLHLLRCRPAAATLFQVDRLTAWRQQKNFLIPRRHTRTFSRPPLFQFYRFLSVSREKNSKERMKWEESRGAELEWENRHLTGLEFLILSSFLCFHLNSNVHAIWEVENIRFCVHITAAAAPHSYHILFLY